MRRDGDEPILGKLPHRVAQQQVLLGEAEVYGALSLRTCRAITMRWISLVPS